jgi:predicted nuclease with TOPRIM domain
MGGQSNDKTYKSPLRKLARFFEQSRDRWKAKSHEGKAKVKRLQNRVRFLERSKADLKSQVKALEAEVVRLKANAHALEQTVEVWQKKGRPNRAG